MCVGIAWHRFSWDEKFEREREGGRERVHERDRQMDGHRREGEKETCPHVFL